MLSKLYTLNLKCTNVKSAVRWWGLLAFAVTVALLVLLPYRTDFENQEPPIESDANVEIDYSYREQIEQIALALSMTNSDIVEEAHAATKVELPGRLYRWAKSSVPWFKAKPWRSQSDVDDPFACHNQPLPLSVVLQIIATQLAYSNESLVDAAFPPLAWITEERSFAPKSKVCVRVILPAPKHDPSNAFWYQYKPFGADKVAQPMAWWDTMMVWAHHEETGAALQLKMRPWSGYSALRDKHRAETNDGQTPIWFVEREEEVTERNLIHVYEAEIELRDPGHYRLEARLEFIQAQWNFENGPIVPYKGQLLPFYPSSSSTEDVQPVLEVQNLANDDTANHTADQILEEHLALPFCTGGDHPGRWLTWKGDKANTTVVAGMNMHSKFWAPYDCRYRHLRYTEFNRCLARKFPRGIDLYGDSNIRRAVKKVLTHGRWCEKWQDHREDVELDPNTAMAQAETPTEWRWTGHPGILKACQCEDHFEPGWSPNWFASDNVEKNNIVFENSKTQSIELGRTEWDREPGQESHKPDGVPVTSYKLDGLTQWNQKGWEYPFSDPVVPRDVVIVSLGNWDPAYMTFDEFGKQLDKFVDKLIERYGATETKIVYRTAQYYCCRVDTSNRHRRTSGPRAEAFNLLASEVLVRRMNATVWDTSILGESQTWEEKQERVNCPSNHASADMVEIENQILMNALCNS